MITTETIWHMHCVIMAMANTNLWEEWTGLTHGMTESEVKAKAQGNEEKCLAIWSLYCSNMWDNIHTSYDTEILHLYYQE